MESILVLRQKYAPHFMHKYAKQKCLAPCEILWSTPLFPAVSPEKPECPVSAVLSLAHGCRGAFKFGPILLQNCQVALLKSGNCLMLQYLPSGKIGASTPEHRFEPYRQTGMCEYTLLGVF